LRFFRRVATVRAALALRGRAAEAETKGPG
jgi:hypothetical protein